MNEQVNPQHAKRANIKLDWIFGIRKDITPNILLLDSDNIVYPAGHYIVIYNHVKKVPQSQLQQFIPGQAHSQGIVAFTTTNITKKFIAVAEEFNEDVVISIYNIFNQGGAGVYNLHHKVQNVSLYESRIIKILHMAFSQKENLNLNFFAVLCKSEEELQLLIWKWDNEQLKEKLPVSITKIAKLEPKDWIQVTFTPFKNENLCIVTSTHLFYHQIIGRTFPSLYDYNFEKNGYGKIVSYCWLFEFNFCVLTETTIVILDLQNPNSKFVQEIKLSIDDFTGTFTCVLALLDAFIIAGTRRRFEIYERKNNESYVLSKKGTSEFDKENIFDFVCLACPNAGSGSEKTIFASTSKNNLITMNIRDSNEVLLTKISAFSYMICPFHSDSIEGIDVCINKPYVISCSKDKTLRIWDYKKRSQVIEDTFDDEMYSVAYHPSGMHAVVSFSEKVKPINIFYDEILSMIPQGGGLQAKKAKDVIFNIIFRLNSRMEANILHSTMEIK